MRPLTSPRAKRISGSKEFRASPKKDFFNNIGAKRKLASARPAAVVVRFKLAMNQVMPKIEKISQVGVALEG